MSTIKLINGKHSITLSQKVQKITLKQKTQKIFFKQSNLRGLPGEPNVLDIGTVESGPEPEVTITGDSPHQTLNFVIPDGTGTSGDKNFSETFSPTDSLFVTHNLNKYPAVDIINSAGDQVVGNVNYLSLNTLLVTFSASFGGRITCN